MNCREITLNNTRLLKETKRNWKSLAGHRPDWKSLAVDRFIKKNRTEDTNWRGKVETSPSAASFPCSVNIYSILSISNNTIFNKGIVEGID